MCCWRRPCPQPGVCVGVGVGVCVCARVCVYVCVSVYVCARLHAIWHNHVTAAWFSHDSCMIQPRDQLYGLTTLPAVKALPRDQLYGITT
jgi:hypothetical protein